MMISRDSGRGQAGTSGLLAAEYVDPRDLSARSPVRELARAFLQDQLDKGRSPKTISKYAVYVAEFLAFLERTGKAVRISDVDLRTLKAFGSHLTRRELRAGRDAGKRAVSPATKNLTLIALRGMLKFAVLLDLPVPGPEKVELAKAPDPSPDARHLEAERLKRLLEAFDGMTDATLRGRALLEFMVSSGCRVSEVVGLDRAQLELDRRAKTPNGDGIRVTNEVTVLGKGNRHRRVFLNDRARGWLMRYLQTRKDRDAALFVTRKRSQDGSYRMSVWTAERIVAEAAKRAGLAENVSPHWMRHAAITAWAAEINLPAAQRLAGHRNVATTSRYLGGSDAELKRLFMERMNR